MTKVLAIVLLIYSVSIAAQASEKMAIQAFEARDLKLAESIWLQQDEGNYKKHLYLAKIELLKGNIDQAEQSVKQALQLQKQDAEVHYIAAKIFAERAENASVFSVMGYIKKVKSFLGKAVALAPENVEYQRTLIHFHVQAPSILGGDINVALRQAQALKQVDQMSGLLSLIQAYDHMNERDKFDTELAAALQEFSHEPEFYYRLGLYYQQKPDYQQAFFYLQKAVEQVEARPLYSNIKYNVLFQYAATSVSSQQNLDTAEQFLYTFIDNVTESHLLPSKHQARFYLAEILSAKGDKQAALKLYRQVAEQAVHGGLKEQARKKL